MDTFESQKQYFERDFRNYRQAVKLLNNRSDVLSGGCASYGAGGRILEELGV